MDDRHDNASPSASGEYDWADLHLWQIRFIRDILGALTAVALFWLGYALRDVTIPLLVALLLAYLAEPAVRWTAEAAWIPFRRLGAVILFVTLFIVLVLAMIAFVIPPTVNQLMQLADDVESGSVRAKLIDVTKEYVPESIRPELLELLDFLPQGRPSDQTAAPSDSAETAGSTDPASVKEPSSERSALAAAATVAVVAAAAPPPKEEKAADESDSDSPDGSPPVLTDPEQMATAARSHAGMLFGIVRQGGTIAWAVVLEIITIGMLLFLIPFYFFFFSLWYPRVSDFIDSMIPDRDRDRTRDLLAKMDAAVSGFVRGRILIAIIMSALLVAGYMFVGVPYAILLGILVGFVSIVPYLGLIGIPVAIILMFVGQLEVSEADRMAWWGILLWPTVVYTVVSGIDGWILTPWIQGKSTNLDPVTIFVAILAGGSVLGVYGMLISIPVAACIKILLIEIVIPKLREMGARPRAGRPLA